MLTTFIFKRSYSGAFALFIATIIGYYFSFAGLCWFLLPILLVMQTTIGVTLRQGLQIYLASVIGVFLGSCLGFFLGTHSIELQLVVFVLFIGTGIVALQRTDSFWTSPIFAGGLFFLFASTLNGLEWQDIYARLYDVSMGAAIGIIINLFVLPSRVDVEFRQNSLPIFKKYIRLLTDIENLLFKRREEKKPTRPAILGEEDAYSSIARLKGFLADWIYQPGLSLSLQSGYRYFFMMTERCGEILLSLRSSASFQFRDEILKAMEDPVKKYITGVNSVFTALIKVLSLEPLGDRVDDLQDELLDLQKIMNEILPSLELIEGSEEYTQLARLYENLIDLRVTLLDLGNSLRSNKLE